MVARYWLEAYAGVSCKRRNRFRIPLPASRMYFPGSLLVTISQSGETADTLAALRLAKTLRISFEFNDL